MGRGSWITIRALFVCLIVIPLLSFPSVSGGLGTEPPEHGEVFFGEMLFLALAPASYALTLLEALGVSSGFLGWMVGFIITPLFWGALAYGIVCWCRGLTGMSRQRLTMRWSERRTAVRSHFR